jgi:hypothetical protein
MYLHPHNDRLCWTLLLIALTGGTSRALDSGLKVFNVRDYSLGSIPP